MPDLPNIYFWPEISCAPMTYTNWDVGQPSSSRFENCIGVDNNKFDIVWNVLDCFDVMPFVCETSCW